jgi:hypothetical protein
MNTSMMQSYKMKAPTRNTGKVQNSMSKSFLATKGSDSISTAQQMQSGYAA